MDDINNEIAKFNLNDFFFNENDDNYCAIKIISKDKDICFNVEYHNEGAELIMRNLFDDFKEDFSDNAYWPEIVNEWGCIAIQIVKRNFIIVNIPESINEYQFGKLLDFYQDMVKVNSVLRKTNEEIDIQTNITKNKKFLNLGKALMVLKNKVKNTVQNKKH